MINIDPTLMNILEKMPFDTKLITEMDRNGTTKNFLKVIFPIKDLNYSNWFHFEENETLRAESDSNQIVKLKGFEYLKVYTILSPMHLNIKEIKSINIIKSDYVDGLCYYVKKVYPRPMFLPSTYKVNFASLNKASKDIIKEIYKIDNSINTSIIKISFQTEEKNLVANIYLK